MKGGIHCLPALHFFVKFAIFEFLYFFTFEADLHEISAFCYSATSI